MSNATLCCLISVLLSASPVQPKTAKDVPAKPKTAASTAQRPKGSKTVKTADLELELPVGWVAHPNPGGPAEYRPRGDGSTGILQLSRLPASDVSFISKQESLGAFTETLGLGLGKNGQNWGKSAGHKEGTCGIGRFGFAMFQGGEYPAMLLWVTLSSDSAFMWTWLGPSAGEDEVNQALGIVLNAKQREKSTSK